MHVSGNEEEEEEEEVCKVSLILGGGKHNERFLDLGYLIFRQDASCTNFSALSEYSIIPSKIS